MIVQELFEHSSWDRDESYTEQDLKNIENAANVIVSKARDLGIPIKFSRHFFDQITLKRGSGKIDHIMLMNAVAKFLKRGIRFFDNKPDMTSYAFQDLRSELFLEVLKNQGEFLIRTIIRSPKWLGRSEKIVLEDDLTEWSAFDDGISVILQKKGYKLLGKGVDQMAFLEPGTGQVLKIFGHNGTNKLKNEDHKMFADWADYCRSNSDNPFLPKFSGWKRFEYNGKGYLQIRMEKLAPFPYGWQYGLHHMSAMVASGVSLEEFEADVAEEGMPEEVNEVIVHIGGDGFRLLYQTMEEIESIARQNGYSFDLHGGNFLIRNDGTPVIVDPWVL